jgi:hypothetical protein
MPILELLFPLNCRLHITKHLIVHQLKDGVFRRETPRNLFPVLPNPLFQRGGDANINRATRLAGEEVNARLLVIHKTGHGLSVDPETSSG